MPSIKRNAARTAVLWLLLIGFAKSADCQQYFLPLQGDLGWIPDYKKLNAKLGLGYLTSNANFLSDNSIRNITYKSQTLQASDLSFFIEPEFGIAPDWAALLHVGFVRASMIQNGASALSGNGIADSVASLKWNLQNPSPLLTAEVFLKLPTGSSVVDTSQLATGEGNFDLGLVLHTGIRSGRVRISFSPGGLARFGGYASAAIADGSIRLEFARGFIQAHFHGIYSFTDSALFDSKLDVHDGPGTGGTFLRLNGSPTGATVGGKMGLTLFENFGLDAALDVGVFGARYPNFYQVTVSLRNLFDFFTQPNVKKVREIPLDSESAEKAYERR